MPPRRPGWTPRLAWHGARKCGRVRIPGRGVVYLGKKGCWPSRKHKPPDEVVEAYNRAVARWLAAQANGPAVAIAPGCTIAQLVDAYLEYAEKTYRKRDQPTRYVSNTRSAVRPLVEMFGSLPAEAFTASDLRTIRELWEREARWNRATINASLDKIRRVFQWGAAERDLFSTDVWLRLKAVRGLQRHRTSVREPKPERPVLAELVQATLPHLPAVIAAMVRLQQATGMRGLEICWMRASEITEEADGLWRYVASDEGNKLAHKGIPKIVYLGPQAQAILRPWRKAAQKLGPETFLFRRQHGPRGTSDNVKPHRYNDIIRETCDAAGIERWRVRQLRHMKATDIRREYGREGAQAALGHSEPETTERYSSLALEDLARRIARETG